MKPWIKRALSGVLGVSLLVGGLTACSGARYHHGPMDTEKLAEVRGKMVGRISSKLDLNEVQKQKLNALADKLEAQRTALMGQGPEPRGQMQALVAGEKFDRARAQTLMDEKTRALQAHGPEVINALADFYDSLRPEQQQTVRDWMQRRRGWMSRHG